MQYSGKSILIKVIEMPYRKKKMKRFLGNIRYENEYKSIAKVTAQHKLTANINITFFLF